ncbi:hypothetical protein BB559_002625 [Furculomyces boomerangus]|uniref:Amino acid permease/ SLC12A domain-containing protein n=1 Tax=Furculomyces boomerangus TaxID=61424 RepID=A0A2T9YTP0_9FUNG|nr:hypothetical protein BB559_002625 [Furculomyces boomerangus]
MEDYHSSEPCIGKGVIINVVETQDYLQRTLKSRHMTMIAIGGTISTGLFVGSGAALSTGGPGGALVAYILSGLIIFFVLTSLGEMSTYIPVAGSFNSFAGRFIEPSLGFSVGYNYWYAWILTSAIDLVGASILMQFWVSKSHINPFVWTVIVYVIVVFLNLFGARYYGEAEFWLSLIKVISILAFIIIGLLFIFDWIGKTEKVGTSNWNYGDAPFIVPYDDPNLLNSSIDHITVSPLVLVMQKSGIKVGDHIINAVVLSSVISAGNSGLYLATRTLYALAVEGKSFKMFAKVNRYGTPLNSLIFGAIITGIFMSISLIAGNDKVYIWFVSVTGISGFISYCVILFTHWRFRRAYILQGYSLYDLPYKSWFYPFVISAGNSGLYLATRTLYALAVEGKSFKMFAKVNRYGTPLNSLIFGAIITGIFMSISLIAGNDKVYIWFVSVTGISGFISYCVILFTHWRFRRAYILQGYSLYDLPYKSWFYPFGSFFSFFVLIFIILAQGYETFIGVKFQAVEFCRTYIGIPIFIILYVVHKLITKSKLIPLIELDLETDSYIQLGFPNERIENSKLKEKIKAFFSF